VVPKAADVTNSLRNVPNVCSTGSPIVNRPHELEIMRRSVAMLTPGATAQLTREEAMRLIAEVKEAQARIERLRLALRDVLDDLER